VIFLPHHVPHFEEVDHLPASSRGEKGFGSSGHGRNTNRI
jgi:dUTPase